jgi:hypothetical protein
MDHVIQYLSDHLVTSVNVVYDLSSILILASPSIAWV